MEQQVAAMSNAEMASTGLRSRFPGKTIPEIARSLSSRAYGGEALSHEESRFLLNALSLEYVTHKNEAAQMVFIYGLLNGQPQGLDLDAQSVAALFPEVRPPKGGDAPSKEALSEVALEKPSSIWRR